MRPEVPEEVIVPIPLWANRDVPVLESSQSLMERHAMFVCIRSGHSDIFDQRFFDLPVSFGSIHGKIVRDRVVSHWFQETLVDCIG